LLDVIVTDDSKISHLTSGPALPPKSTRQQPIERSLQEGQKPLFLGFHIGP